MAAESADPRIGTVIEDRYRILSRIASGGMGVVYRAERLQLGRTVAIKFLDAANAADETSRARFEREAKAMSRLSHPHCVSVIDFGVADTPFIVMDYVTGQPLISLIHTKKKVRAERAVNVMKQVMAGLAHAHRHEVVHRDVKPANIMLTEATGTGDFVRILDFGLAKLRGAASLSSANIVVGTPSYMSPEQGSGKPLDARSDIYSAGVVLYELLIGDKPFVGEDAFHTLRMHQQDSVPMLGAIRGTDEMRIALDGVIQKALAKKPKDRYQTALSMGDALSRIEESHRDLRRPRGKRAISKRDPARATTQLPTADGKIESGTERLEEELDTPPVTRSRAGALGVLLLVMVLGVSGYLGYRHFLTGDADRTSTDKALVGQTDNRHNIEPVARDAMASIDAGVFDAAEVSAPGVLADAGTLDAADGSPDAAPLAIDEPEDAAAADADAVVAVDDTDDQTDPPGADELDAGAVAVVPSGPPKNVDEVRAIAASGQTKRAITGLRALIKASPKNGYYHRTLGDLNIERGWWTEGLSNYQKAVRLTPRYKSFRSINENAIRALGIAKVRRRAERFIRSELGRSSISYLRVAARSHKSTLVQKRAAALLKRIR